MVSAACLEIRDTESGSWFQSAIIRLCKSLIAPLASSSGVTVSTAARSGPRSPSLSSGPKVRKTRGRCCADPAAILREPGHHAVEAIVSPHQAIGIREKKKLLRSAWLKRNGPLSGAHRIIPPTLTTRDRCRARLECGAIWRSSDAQDLFRDGLARHHCGPGRNGQLRRDARGQSRGATRRASPRRLQPVRGNRYFAFPPA